MKKIRAILPVMVLALMMGTLSACGGARSAPEPPQDNDSPSVQETARKPETYPSMPAVNQLGHPLVYDNYGVFMYAGGMGYTSEHFAGGTSITSYSHYGNNSENYRTLELKIAKVNGASGTATGLYEFWFGVTLKPHTQPPDKVSWVDLDKVIYQRVFDLPTIEYPDGDETRIRVDPNVDYFVEGEYWIYDGYREAFFGEEDREAADLLDCGTFSFTLPAGMDAYGIRTDEVWTSTK
jgi:hypothetical protein